MHKTSCTSNIYIYITRKNYSQTLYQKTNAPESLLYAIMIGFQIDTVCMSEREQEYHKIHTATVVLKLNKKEKAIVKIRNNISDLYKRVD